MQWLKHLLSLAFNVLLIQTKCVSFYVVEYFINQRMFFAYLFHPTIQKKSQSKNSPKVQESLPSKYLHCSSPGDNSSIFYNVTKFNESEN